jgi:hypothetical protein
MSDKTLGSASKAAERLKEAQGATVGAFLILNNNGARLEEAAEAEKIWNEITNLIIKLTD